MVSDPVAAIDWRQRAAEITIDEGIFVGGERRAAINGITKVVRSVRDGSKLIELAWAQAADADAAVAAARNAFDHGPWPQLHPRDRGRILQDFASLIEQHRDEVALLIRLEMGKPIRDAHEIELLAIIRCLRADQVVDRIVQTSHLWFPADPLLSETKMGPLVDERSLERVLRHLDRGLAEGAALRIGGQRVLTETGGAYLEPTVVTGVRPDNPIVRDELFGPVLAGQVVDGKAEAVRVAGDTPYGLAAALWTSDLGTAHRVSRALRAGTVWVNCYEEGDMAVPFGGVKLSGFGRDKSRHALEEYTYFKTRWIRYA